MMQITLSNYEKVREYVTKNYKLLMGDEKDGYYGIKDNYRIWIWDYAQFITLRLMNKSGIYYKELCWRLKDFDISANEIIETIKSQINGHLKRFPVDTKDENQKLIDDFLGVKSEDETIKAKGIDGSNFDNAYVFKYNKIKYFIGWDNNGNYMNFATQIDNQSELLIKLLKIDINHFLKLIKTYLEEPNE